MNIVRVSEFLIVEKLRERPLTPPLPLPPPPSPPTISHRCLQKHFHIPWMFFCSNFCLAFSILSICSISSSLKLLEDEVLCLFIFAYKLSSIPFFVIEGVNVSLKDSPARRLCFNRPPFTLL